MSEKARASSLDSSPEMVGFPVSFGTQEATLGGFDDGFNEYGVRENEDGSIDVRFAAMEPGIHNGIEITPEYLDTVFSKNYGRRPIQISHSKDQLSNVGWVKPDKAYYDNSKEWVFVEGHIPNTGSSVRTDVISDFTHNPPAITNGSIGFNPRSLTAKESDNEEATAKFVDGEFMEFSLTPFPAGYDSAGGLTAAFEQEFGWGSDDGEPGQSYLNARKERYTVREI